MNDILCSPMYRFLYIKCYIFECDGHFPIVEIELFYFLQIYDKTYYLRTMILALLTITFVASLLLYALFEVLEPIYAKPLKKISY